jgi:GT2 family glycosyltransferase
MADDAVNNSVVIERNSDVMDVNALCAVIIVTWNCWEHLYRCLNGLELQTCRDFRIIVVDNGDACSEQVDRLQQYENLTYLKSPSNLGFAAGNNRGLELIQDAKWVVLLNPDTLPAFDWFEKMMEAAVRYPDFDIFGSRLLQVSNPAILDGDGDCYHISGFAWRNGMGLLAKNKHVEPWEIFSPCAAAALYQADVLKQVGGFDEDFFCYMEDIDLGFRLRLAGYRCLTVPDAEVLHVGSGTTGKRSPFYIYYGQRNLVWAYVKNMPGILFWLFLPLHVALNIAGILRYALCGQLGVILRAKYDAVKGLPKIWKKRREIQKARVISLLQILKVLDKRPVPGLGRAVSSLWK